MVRGRRRRGEAQSLRARLRRQNLVSGGGERDAEQVLNLQFVVDDKDARPLHDAGLAAIVVGSTPGSRMRMRVPRRRRCPVRVLSRDG